MTTFPQNDNAPFSWICWCCDSDIVETEWNSPPVCGCGAGAMVPYEISPDRIDASNLSDAELEELFG